MTAFGEMGLPVLVVDGDIAVHGRYPSRDERGDAQRAAHAGRAAGQL
jgi:hypothetical protein